MHTASCCCVAIINFLRFKVIADLCSRMKMLKVPLGAPQTNHPERQRTSFFFVWCVVLPTPATPQPLTSDLCVSVPVSITYHKPMTTNVCSRELQPINPSAVRVKCVACQELTEAAELGVMRSPPVGVASDPGSCTAMWQWRKSHKPYLPLCSVWVLFFAVYTVNCMCYFGYNICS